MKRHFILLLTIVATCLAASAEVTVSTIDFRPFDSETSVWGSFCSPENDALAVVKPGASSDDEKYFSVTTAAGKPWDGAYIAFSAGNALTVSANKTISKVRIYANSYGSSMVSSSRITATDGTNELTSVNGGYKASGYGFGSSEHGYSEWTPQSETYEVDFSFINTANVQVVEVYIGSDDGEGSGTATFEGEGTAANPFLVSTPAQLAALANGTKHYALANDIDLDGIAWTPIVGFTGQLDGCGYTISNVTIVAGNVGWSDPASTEIGLFGAMGDFSASTVTSVKNLNVSNISITLTEEYNSAAGGIASSAYGVDFENVTIDGLKLTSTFNRTGQFVFYSPRFGGIAGEASNASSLTNCVVKGLDFVDVRGSETGGLVGAAKLATIISDCSVEGSIVTAAAAGSIVGVIPGGQATVVQRCHSNVDIKGYSSIGGIVGEMLSGSVVSCVSEGTVTASASAGGIVGYIDTGEGNASSVNDCLSLVTMTCTAESSRTVHSVAGWTTEDSQYVTSVSDKHIPQGVTNCYALHPFVAKSDLDAATIYIDLDEYYEAHEGKTVTEADITTEFMESLGIGTIMTAVSTPVVSRNSFPETAFDLSGKAVNMNSNRKGIIIYKGKKIIR